MKSHTASYIEFFATKVGLRVIISLLVMTAFLVPSVYGQSPGELGYRFVPSKIIEDTEGTLQVYLKDGFPRKINDLVVTSSDPSIVQIVGIEQNLDSMFTTVVKIKAMSDGDAMIALAAPGLSPSEVPIIVYPDDNVATHLLMKITPDVFSLNGPKKGYVSVELVNEYETPVFASEDTIVHLNTPDPDVIYLKESSLVIKSGEYFAVGQFEVKGGGEANLFASTSNGMTNGKITVGSDVSEQIIRPYVYPQIINNYFPSFAYLVVQLQDSAGNPVIAKEDISVSVQVTTSQGESENPDGQDTDSTKSESVNSSDPDNADIVRPVGHLVIRQGDYWGYIQLAVKAGLSGTFDIGVSAKGYLVPAPAPLQTTLIHTMDDKLAKIDMMPILATGEKEMVGILHLEDADGFPVISRDDLIVEVDSTDPHTLSVDNVHMKRGDSVVPVFGKAEKTGNSITLNVITEVPQILNPLIALPPEDQMSLVVEPLVEKVLVDTTFPMAFYLSESDGTQQYSTIDANLIISPMESIVAEQKALQQGQAINLFDSKIVEEGSTDLSFAAGQYSADVIINALSYGPASVSLNYPEKFTSNSDNVLAVELVDAQNLPVFANEDIEIKLVSSEPFLVGVPQDITISKGRYYSLFDVRPSSTGDAKLSILTNGMQLSEFSLAVTGLNPQLSLSANDLVEPNTAFDALLSAQYDNMPIPGLRVDWDIQGAVIQNLESTTDESGNARASLLSVESGQVALKATVSGSPFMDATASKGIIINATQVVQEQPAQPESFNIMGLDPIYLVIPAAAAGAVFVLKKKGLLGVLTERFDFVAKISEIKERIVQIRS